MSGWELGLVARLFWVSFLGWIGARRMEWLPEGLGRERQPLISAQDVPVALQSPGNSLGFSCVPGSGAVGIGFRQLVLQGLESHKRVLPM